MENIVIKRLIKFILYFSPWFCLKPPHQGSILWHPSVCSNCYPHQPAFLFPFIWHLIHAVLLKCAPQDTSRREPLSCSALLSPGCSLKYSLLGLSFGQGIFILNNHQMIPKQVIQGLYLEMINQNCPFIEKAQMCISWLYFKVVLECVLIFISCPV